MKRMRAKLDFCACCAVNLIQSISQNRSNKRIILKDFAYIFGTALIPHFGGGTDQYQIGSSHVYKRGYLIDWEIVYLKGAGNGQVKVLWGIFNDWMVNPVGMRIIPSVRFFPTPGRVVNADSILGGLLLNNGEYKIVFRFSLVTASTVILPNGKNALTTTWREKLGFLFLEPRPIDAGGTGAFYADPLTTRIAFTPKPGLFIETVPG